MTKIEWTKGADGTPGKSWNPVSGCTPCSEGCAHCYAKRMAHRPARRYGYPEAPHEFDVTLHPGKLGTPLYWRKPARIFVCSMSDLFHPSIPTEFVEDVLSICIKAQRHTFVVLTKRPERAIGILERFCSEVRFLNSLQDDWVMPNVWMGATCENQRRADERIPILLQIPAAVHWLSLEPMLGPIVLPADFLALGKRAWVVAGGETGPGARPAHPDWLRSVRDQCTAAGVPFFFKSWGEWLARSQGALSSMGQRWGALDCEGKFWPYTTTWNGRQEDGPDGEAAVVRVGRKAAGRLLDGRLHEEWPEATE